MKKKSDLLLIFQPISKTQLCKFNCTRFLYLFEFLSHQVFSYESTFKVLQKKFSALWYQIRLDNWSTLEVMFANIKRLMIEVIEGAGCCNSGLP